MCGFAGIVHNGIDNSTSFESEIKIMLSKISHRGPDESKIWFDKTNGIYLGFSRLAMIDLEKSGQPFFDKQYAVMFNGEIYNFKSLKAKLMELGDTFRTNGEVEVILKMYLRFGNDFVKQLDGMFAICIINIETNELFLARDRFGVKPLYYSVINGIVCFFSELKALPSFVDRKIDSKGLSLYFNLRFIPAPFTIYKDVFKLKAGEYISVDKNSNMIATQYHPYNTEKDVYPPEYANLAAVLIDSIYTTYSNSDVPIGLFLSGGIDSGIIASLLRKEVRSFSVGYDTPGSLNQEINIINRICESLQITPNRIMLSDSILSLLNDAVYHLDEPFYSSVSVSTYSLAKQASKYVKGVMTGDGSDELLFGYEYLRSALTSSSEYEKYLSGIGWLKYESPSEWLTSYSFGQDEIKHILFSDCEVSGNIPETLRRVELYKRLPDYHMMRVDKLTMAFGLEARVPYLRNDYADFMLSIDSSVFLKEKDTKAVLKNSFRNLLPRELLCTIKKPFTAPIKQWLEHELKEDVCKLINDKWLLQQLPLNCSKITQLLTNYRGTYADVSNLWGIYLLLKWCEINLK